MSGNLYKKNSDVRKLCGLPAIPATLREIVDKKIQIEYAHYAVFVELCLIFSILALLSFVFPGYLPKAMCVKEVTDFETN